MRTRPEFRIPSLDSHPVQNFPNIRFLSIAPSSVIIAATACLRALYLNDRIFFFLQYVPLHYVPNEFQLYEALVALRILLLISNVDRRYENIPLRTLKARAWRYLLTTSWLIECACVSSLSFLRLLARITLTGFICVSFIACICLPYGGNIVSKRNGTRHSFPRIRVLRGWYAPVLLTCHHVQVSRDRHLYTTFTFPAYSFVNLVKLVSLSVPCQQTS